MLLLRNRRPLLAAVAMSIPLLAAGLLAPTPGAAQQAPTAITAYTTANVNQRAGPGTRFPVITTVPVRTRIGLYGCLQPVDWCDVEFHRTRGWMSADYIQAWYQGRYYPLRQVSRQLNVAVVIFDINIYWRTYYRDRPFYAELPRWRAPDRPPTVNVNIFYDRLAPHGRWVWWQGHYVWVPAGVGPDWRPYTLGRWVYTQRYGWMWVSDEPFGWATYHHGRWGFSKRIGWFWVPDTRWGPAWVSWRRSDDHLAWAPLPPSGYDGAYFDVSVRHIPDYYWQVVPAQSFLTINIFNVIIKDRDRHHAALEQAEVLGSVEIVDDQAVNAALPVTFVEEKTEEPVVALQVVETDDPEQAESTEGDAVEVFTLPPEPEEAPAEPPEVTPIEVVEEESVTKEQAGEEPATEDLVPPPEPEAAPAEEPPAEEPPSAEEEAPPPADEEEPPPPEEEPPPPPAEGEEPPPPPAEGEEPPPPPAEEEEPPPPPPADEEPPPPPAEEEEPPPPPPAEEEPPPPPPAEGEEPPPPPAEGEEPPPPPPAEEEPPPPPPAEGEEPPPPPAEEEEPPPPPPVEEEEPPPPPEPEPEPPQPPEPPPPVEEEPPPPPPPPEEPPPCPEGTERQPDGSCE